MRLWGWGEKTQKGKKNHLLYSWKTPLAQIMFLWCNTRLHVQDVLQSSLRSCGPSPRSLSESVVVTVVPSSLSKVAPGYLSTAISSEGKQTTWWSSGVRGNGCLQHGVAALLSATSDIFACGAWGCVKSNHICLLEINKQKCSEAIIWWEQ